ncbi:MAG TPA: vWA domain-containing protein [Spirochaetia bacterium]|nr:vWA domain-containing protein [Spirochaetia bacterium]
MGIQKRLLFALLLCAVLVSPLAADKRTQNIDIIIALDKSLSMEHKIVAVRDWVNSYLIDQLVIPGDDLVVVAFYGKADVVISQVIKDDADKAAVKKIIGQIRGNGRFTDIGNALDVLKAQIAQKESDGREKYVLLLTDGIQEAPPTSKYYSKDGRFNHEFLNNTKTIQQKGWKVMILGIGQETAAKDLAHELASSYVTVSGNPTAGDIARSAGGLFGGVQLQGGISASPVGADGSSTLTFKLKTSGLQGDSSVTVSGISAQVGGGQASNILAAPLSFSVKKGSEAEARVPVKFPPSLPPGSSSATLAFSFPSGQGFAPSEVSVPLRVKSWPENNVPLLGGGALIAIILIAAAVFLILRLTRGGSLAFSVLVDDDPVGGGPVSLAVGHELFLNEREGAFSLIGKKNARSLARFAVRDRKLSMSVLKAERFPKLADVPEDARGHSFVLKSENGRKLDLTIRARKDGAT